MISNPNRTVALSSIGWVERDAIWKLDVVTGEVSTIACEPGARYITLFHTAASETLAAAHHYEGHRFEVVVVQISDGRVLKSVRLQEARQGVNEFVGDFSFSPNGDLCMVARALSGDVLALDATTLKTRSSVRLGKQPLELLALSESDLVSRDWKTGALLRGTLK